MKKIAVVGPYGTGEDFTTGQAVKCFEVINWLKSKYGEDDILIVNTYKWKKHPISLFVNMIKAFIQCKNVVIMPAQHGAKVFIPMSFYFKKIFGRSVHYIVIGGWLRDMLDVEQRLKIRLSSFDGIYVETRKMVSFLLEIGLEQTMYMPNCRLLPKEIPDKQNNYGSRVPICTYSRVTKEKGIIDAIEIVKYANEIIGENIFTLEVYGKVAEDFKDEFDTAIFQNQEIVSYCGVKNSDEGIETLSRYFALLFPTFYEGEGFAGTILDAFASKTPVIANDWKYNSEIIENGNNGFIYNYRDNKQAADYLCELYKNADMYRHVQEGCCKSAQIFSTDKVMGDFCLRLM